MTGKQFWFRLMLAVEKLSLSRKDLSDIIETPLWEYNYMVSNGSLPNKKTRTRWLKKLCIPKDLFENDLEIYANYLEKKWSMQGTK